MRTCVHAYINEIMYARTCMDYMQYTHFHFGTFGTYGICGTRSLRKCILVHCAQVRYITYVKCTIVMPHVAYAYTYMHWSAYVQLRIRTLRTYVDVDAVRAYIRYIQMYTHCTPRCVHALRAFVHTYTFVRTCIACMRSTYKSYKITWDMRAYVYTYMPRT
jgi:hypothetical protein